MNSIQERKIKTSIHEQLTVEFKTAQAFGFKRTQQQFARELHKRYKEWGVSSCYHEVYLKAV